MKQSLEIKQGKRIFWLDFIKVLAMFSILTVHFNAAVSYMFTLSYKVLPNFILGGVYLGDFGVTLFFIASGAGFVLSVRGELRVGDYYLKRFRAIYPMFWIAWIVVFFMTAFMNGFFPEFSLLSLFLTLSGMDGYSMTLGGPGGYYYLGEWFLGCIILIYIVAPLIYYFFKKSPVVTFISACVLSALCDTPFVPTLFYSNIWVIKRIPEFIFGMLLVYLSRRFEKTFYRGSLAAGMIGGCGIYLFNRTGIFQYRYPVLMTSCCFLVLIFVGNCLKDTKYSGAVARLGTYLYPVFLIHHWPISTFANTFFDMSALGMRKVYLLYAAYLVMVFSLAYLLIELTKVVTKRGGILAAHIHSMCKTVFCSTDSVLAKNVPSSDEGIESRIGKEIVYINTVIAIYIFSVTEILSVFKALTRRAVLISWAAFFVCLMCVLLFNRKASASHGTKRLQISLRKHKTVTAQVAIALGLVLVLGFLSWKIVPYNADSMAYHCARILHWVQNRSVDYYPTNIFTQLCSPPMAEYVVMQTYFLFGSDVVFNMVQWYAYIIDAAMIYFICRKLNVRREMAMVGSLLMMTMPIAIAESSTTQVDLFSSVWLLFFVYLAIGFSQYKEVKWTRKQILEAVLAGSIAGLGYISKNQICLQMLIVAIWLLVVRLLKKDKVKNLLGFVGMAGMSAIPFVLPSWIRNYKFAGDIFAANYFNTIAIGTGIPKYVLLNIVKNWAKTSITHTSTAVNEYIQEFVHSFADAVCVNIDDPLITYSSTFDAVFSPTYHCDVAPAPAVGIGLFIAIVIALLLTTHCIASNKTLPRNFTMESLLLLAVLSGFALVRWQGWVTRLLLPTYMLSIIYIILVFDDLFEIVGINGLKSAFTIALPLVLLYTSLGAINYSVQYYERCTDSGTRMEAYFLDRPWHYQPYAEVMSYVKEKNYSTVGLWMQSWHYEYPLQVGIEDETTQIVQVVPDAPNELVQPDCIVSIEMQNFSLGDVFEYRGKQYVCTYLCQSDSAFAILELA